MICVYALVDCLLKNQIVSHQIYGIIAYVIDKCNDKNNGNTKKTKTLKE